GGAQPEIAEPHDLALAHPDAARDLREIFADTDTDDQFLDFAEPALRGEAFGVTRKLAQRLHVGREPGKTVGRALLAVEQLGDAAAFDGDTAAQLLRRVGQ